MKRNRIHWSGRNPTARRRKHKIRNGKFLKHFCAVVFFKHSPVHVFVYSVFELDKLTRLLFCTLCTILTIIIALLNTPSPPLPSPPPHFVDTCRSFQRYNLKTFSEWLCVQWSGVVEPFQNLEIVGNVLIECREQQSKIFCISVRHFGKCVQAMQAYICKACNAHHILISMHKRQATLVMKIFLWLRKSSMQLHIIIIAIVICQP